MRGGSLLSGVGAINAFPVDRSCVSAQSAPCVLDGVRPMNRYLAYLLAALAATTIPRGQPDRRSLRWTIVSWGRRTFDGWRCRGCGASGPILHAHHFNGYSSSYPWKLVTLCQRCHEEVHGRV